MGLLVGTDVTPQGIASIRLGDGTAIYGAAPPPPTGIAFVGYDETYNSSSSPYTLTVPAGTTAGDIIIILSATSTNTPPVLTGISGTTQNVADEVNSTTVISMWSKVSDGSEASDTLTFTVGTFNKNNCCVLVYRDATLGAANFNILGGSSTESITPSLSVTEDDSVLISMFSVRSGDVTDLSTPAGHTDLFENIGVSSNANSMLVTTKAVDTGSTGTAQSDFTGGNGRDGAIAVVLEPA